MNILEVVPLDEAIETDEKKKKVEIFIETARPQKRKIFNLANDLLLLLLW